MTDIVLIALALAVCWFAWRAWQESARLTQSRRCFLDGLDGALSDVSKMPLPSGYSKVTGQYRGLPAVVEPIVDTLNVRKLPVLWLMITVPSPVPVRATVDLMMRASGMEVFSNYAKLEHEIQPPSGFPEWSGIRTDDPSRLFAADIFARYLGRFHDGSGKELLVTPKGLRMVVMADQADRGGYLIFRDARFGSTADVTGTVRAVLDELHALKADLSAVAAHATQGVPT